MREFQIVLYATLAVVLFAFSLFRGSCVSESVAVQAVETQGYADINVIDHAWLAVGLRGCGTSDAARFTVKAKNPAGKVVEVYICSGWLLKSATLRVP